MAMRRWLARARDELATRWRRAWSMVDARDLCTGAGLGALALGLWFAYGWHSAVVVGAVLIYLGIWHPLLVAVALREK